MLYEVITSTPDKSANPSFCRHSPILKEIVDLKTCVKRVRILFFRIGISKTQAPLQVHKARQVLNKSRVIEVFVEIALLFVGIGMQYGRITSYNVCYTKLLRFFDTVAKRRLGHVLRSVGHLFAVGVDSGRGRTFEILRKGELVV